MTCGSITLGFLLIVGSLWLSEQIGQDWPFYVAIGVIALFILLRIFEYAAAKNEEKQFNRYVDNVVRVSEIEKSQSAAKETQHGYGLDDDGFRYRIIREVHRRLFPKGTDTSAATFTLARYPNGDEWWLYSLDIGVKESIAVENACMRVIEALESENG